MRLHQRAGIWLLWWPCAWSLALHAHNTTLPRLLELLALFALGSLLMRSAGCIINDIMDRHLDAKVERTRTRPLASGELSVKQAMLALCLLIAAATIVAWMLGEKVVLWSAAALPLVCAYPLMKRLTHWPQFFLGLTFNWGALVGAVAIEGTITLPALFLYIGCVMWTLGYDTLYAVQDMRDDARAGVKSSALALGDRVPSFVAGCYLVACTFWWMAANHAQLGTLAGGACILMFFALILQLAKANPSQPETCGRAFRSNAKIGWIMLIGWILAIYSQN